LYETNRVRPFGTMNRAQLAQAIGASEHAVRGWLTRGVLKPFPREAGTYYPADVAVGRVFLALQQICGEKSETVAAIAAQVAERLWYAVKNGERGTLRIDASANGITVTVTFTLGQDGEIAVA